MAALALLLVLLGGDVARTLTTYQTEALQAPDRSTFVRVNIEDADAVMVNVCQIDDGYGNALDFLKGVTIRSDADHPISVAEIVLFREIDGLSLSPLMEGSILNLDSGGSYAPHINPARFVEIEVAVMKPGDVPSSGDYERIWEGYIDDPEFGGRGSEIRLAARDPIARLNDTIIESVSTYGGGSPLTQIDVVMQAILDDNMGSGEFPLWVVGSPSFGIEEYKLGNVSVLDALKALADLQGWNLHWLWHESPGEFRLTYYEPDRSNTTADWTFGPDDYYDLPGLKLAQAGIRNAGEVIYLDAAGDEQTVAEQRSTSVATYGRRFIRIDERGSRQIQSSAQASALLTAILDDTEEPIGVQRMDAPFHWPIEVGDVHDYEANGVHYDTTQTWAVFGYTHVLERNRIRTYVQASGKPSGGYTRWRDRELNPNKQYILRTITLPAEAFGGADGEVKASTSASTEEFAAHAPIPDGAILIGMKATGFRANSSDSIEARLDYTFGYSGSPPLPVIFTEVSLSHSVNASSWTTEDSGPLDRQWSAARHAIIISLYADADVEDAKMTSVKLQYLEPVP